MALGYEGVIKLGGIYVLGTGTSVPRARVRMESSSGYGGTITTIGTTGIGLPHNYDWEQHDGSLDFDITSEIITSVLKPWLLNRQTSRTVDYKSRSGNVQLYSDNCFWNSVNINAGGEGSPVTGSVGFVSLARSNYVWGNSYISDKTGMGLLCPAGTFPSPLNASADLNKNPVPFWNTRVVVGGIDPHFVTWSIDFTQEVIKFFGCFAGGGETTPVDPKYLAVGPMTITFTGTYIQTSGGGYLGDAPASIDLNIAGTSIVLSRVENTTEQDDVQVGDSFTPLSVEYVAYEIAA